MLQTWKRERKERDETKRAMFILESSDEADFETPLLWGVKERKSTFENVGLVVYLYGRTNEGSFMSCYIRNRGALIRHSCQMSGACCV